MRIKCLIIVGCFCLLISLNHARQSGSQAAPDTPEPAGWYAGDPHVHADCGVGGGLDPLTPEQILGSMGLNNLAVVSLLADMGNGEVRFAGTDLPRVDGRDFPGSGQHRVLRWDAEWHFDPEGVTFEQKVIGGHLILLGLRQAKRSFSEYTYPIIEWAKKQGAIVGFAHMQYLGEGIPEELNCCMPLEYPVETALHTVDFLMEDVDGSETAISAYYRLLNCGFRPALAAATDFPCNNRRPIGSLLTYAFLPDGKLTYENWIKAIARGRTVISRNGHKEFLELKVNDSYAPGDTIEFHGSGIVRVRIRWSAAMPLSGRLELVENGVVVAGQEASTSPGAPALLEVVREFSRSGWLCARRMDARGHQTHTAAVYVTVNQAPVRTSVADAGYFVRFIENLIRKTSPGGPWNQYFPHDLDAAQTRYRKALEVFKKIAAEAQVRGEGQALRP